jgi:two-component system, NtrC family, response regulator AtoC
MRKTGKKADRVVSDRNIKRILIVDDELLLLHGLGKALQTDATEVITVETGEAALKKVASLEFHLCFLDVFLPDMDGTEVLKRIMTVSPKTKVIMMTAGVINNSRKETIEKIAHMFITKPFDLLQVRMLAKRIFEEPG